MKKSILVGVLAALMLVAFTACENSAPTSPLFGKQVESISVVNQPDYIYRETYNPADINLKVVFNDGSSDEYTALQLGVPAGSLKAQPYTTVSVSSNGKNYYISLQAYEPEGYSIDLSSLKAAKIKADGALTISAVDVVVSYNGGQSKTITATVPAEAGTLVSSENMSDFITANDLKVGKTLTVTPQNIKDVFGIDVSESPVDVEFTGSWDITLVDSTTIMSITAKQTEKVYNVGDSSAIEDAGITVTVYYSDGTSAALPGTGYTVSVDEYEMSYTFPTTGSKPMTIVVTEATTGKQYRTTGFSLEVSADEIEKFTASQITKKEGDDDFKPYEYEAGEDIRVSDFEFKATWKSGYDYVENEKSEPISYSSSDFEAVPSIIPWGTTNGMDKTASFVYKVDNTIPVADATNVHVTNPA